MTMATQGHPLAQTHNERHKKASHDPQHLLTRQGGQEPPCRIKTTHFDGQHPRHVENMFRRDEEGRPSSENVCFNVMHPPCHELK